MTCAESARAESVGSSAANLLVTFDAMRTSIDKLGRIVVPKQIRDAMGLVPGRKVDIVWSDGRVVIEPAPADLEVIDDDGLPVIRALDDDLPVPDPDIARTTLEEIRAERAAHYL